ncbi:MAG: hypothetical protein ACO37H_06885, partial [Burkholderiaceae bacterium]
HATAGRLPGAAPLAVAETLLIGQHRQGRSRRPQPRLQLQLGAGAHRQAPQPPGHWRPAATP